MYIALSKQAAKRYQRLWTSQQDLLGAKSYAAFIAKKNWYEPDWTRKRSIYYQQHAFTTALIVTYARAFIDPRGWERELLDLIGEPEVDRIKLHEELMRLRNQIFAHSDLRLIDVRLFRVSDDTSSPPGYYTKIRHMQLYPNQIALLQTHAADLSTKIASQMLVITSSD